MTDLMYLSSTTSICHIGEKVVKSMTYLLYLSHSTSICCIPLLVVKSTSALHLGKRYSKKSYLLQQKYLQCSVSYKLFLITQTECISFTKVLLEYSTKMENFWGYHMKIWTKEKATFGLMRVVKRTFYTWKVWVLLRFEFQSSHQSWKETFFPIIIIITVMEFHKETTVSAQIECRHSFTI